jgi:hypothetical protein
VRESLSFDERAVICPTQYLLGVAGKWIEVRREVVNRYPFIKSKAHLRTTGSGKIYPCQPSPISIRIVVKPDQVFHFVRISAGWTAKEFINLALWNLDWKTNLICRGIGYEAFVFRGGAARSFLSSNKFPFYRRIISFSIVTSESPILKRLKLKYSSLIQHVSLFSGESLLFNLEGSIKSQSEPIRAKRSW